MLPGYRNAGIAKRPSLREIPDYFQLYWCESVSLPSPGFVCHSAKSGVAAACGEANAILGFFATFYVAGEFSGRAGAFSSRCRPESVVRSMALPWNSFAIDRELGAPSGLHARASSRWL